MTNNIPDNSRLDEAVKNTLNNYEAPFDAADWSRMETMLDAAPKSSSFRWSYAIGAVLGLALVTGGYFAYTNYSSKQNTETTITPPTTPKTEQVTAPAPETITTTEISPATPAPAINTTVEPAATQPATTVASTPAISDNKTNKQADATSTKTPVVKDDKTKKQKNTDVNANPNADVTVHQHVAGMGNEPVFGDMLDSSRGIIGETKEKDETKKAAKAKKDVPVGWNTFMLPNVNTDSLRKYKNMHDSLKVN